jgi:hypothetical protein
MYYLHILNNKKNAFKGSLRFTFVIDKSFMFLSNKCLLNFMFVIDRSIVVTCRCLIINKCCYHAGLFNYRCY